MRRIHLGGLLFEGGEGDATYTIESDSVRGWLLDGVDMRLDQQDRPVSHGSFSQPGYLTGRSISWGGLILTDGPQQQEHAMRALSGLLAGGSTAKMTVENASSHWAPVSRAGEFDMRMRSYGRVASYRVQLWAPNPRIFGDVHTYPVGVPVFHYGNFPAAPVITVVGPQPAYTVTAGTAQFTVSTALPSGSTDVIDMSTGWVKRNGAVLVDGVARAQTWTIPPGLPGVVHTFTGTASGFSVAVTDTFI